MQYNAAKTEIPKVYFFFFLLVAFVFNAFYANSQELYTVSGNVTDKITHQPLVFVNIFLENGLGGTTDIDGKFLFRLKENPKHFI